MRKKQIYILVCATIFCLCKEITTKSYAQQALAVLDSVSVDPATGNVFVGWHPGFEDSVTTYQIIRLDYERNPEHPPDIDLDTIEPDGPFLYIDASINGGTSSYSYRVEGKNGVYTAIHGTMFAEAQYDSCNSKIQLIWSPYIGWDEVKEYIIIDYSTGLLVGTTTDLSFTIGNINQDRIYRFFVRAINEEGYTSSSNRVDIDTDRPDLPSFIKPGSVRVDRDNIELSFVIDPVAEISHYKLYRFIESQKNDSLLISEYSGEVINEFTFVDEGTNFENIYYYILEAIDGCGMAVFSSEVLYNMALELNYSNNLISIDWTDGNIWNEEITYSIYRFDADENPELLSETSGLYYSDNIESIKGQGYLNNLCYYIETSNSFGNINKSFTECIELVPEIYTPPAFYPNKESNNFFRPQFSFIPVNYQIQIIDRNGKLVFKSKDPTESWNAEGLPSATYVYNLTVEKNNGKKIHETGHVSVIRK